MAYSCRGGVVVIRGHGGNIDEAARLAGCRPEQIIDMSSNINPLGTLPQLTTVLAEKLAVIGSLPEVDAGTCVDAFCQAHNLDPSTVVAANGTTQLIYTTPLAMGLKRVLILGPTYADYADACRMHGVAHRHFLMRPQADFELDWPLFEQALSNVDAVFICNPNNPTGGLLGSPDLQRLCRRHASTLFIIDESYLPFAPDGETHSLINLSEKNLIVLNSMSKIFGLPGLRIGFLVAAADLADRFRHYAQPWSLNALAQVAVKWLMTHTDERTAFIRQTRRTLAVEKELFFSKLADLPGLRLFPSASSFVLIRLPAGLIAADMYRQLLTAHLLTRDCANFIGLDERYLRVSLKGTEANRRVANMISQAKVRRAQGNQTG
jgi:threonine-phosphate decarboxylase